MNKMFDNDGDDIRGYLVQKRFKHKFNYIRKRIVDYGIRCCEAYPKHTFSMLLGQDQNKWVERRQGIRGKLLEISLEGMCGKLPEIRREVIDFYSVSVQDGSLLQKDWHDVFLLSKGQIIYEADPITPEETDIFSSYFDQCTDYKKIFPVEDSVSIFGTAETLFLPTSTFLYTSWCTGDVMLGITASAILMPFSMARAKKKPYQLFDESVKDITREHLIKVSNFDPDRKVNGVILNLPNKEFD